MADARVDLLASEPHPDAGDRAGDLARRRHPARGDGLDLSGQEGVERRIARAIDGETSGAERAIDDLERGAHALDRDPARALSGGLGLLLLPVRVFDLLAPLAGRD